MTTIVSDFHGVACVTSVPGRAVELVLEKLIVLRLFPGVVRIEWVRLTKLVQHRLEVADRAVSSAPVIRGRLPKLVLQDDAAITSRRRIHVRRGLLLQVSCLRLGALTAAYAGLDLYVSRIIFIALRLQLSAAVDRVELRLGVGHKHAVLELEELADLEQFL